MNEKCLIMEVQCGWDGLAKQRSNSILIDQSKFDQQSIFLSGPYGDDVAAIKQSNEQIFIGLSDGVSGNRQHGIDPYEFSHQLINECCFYSTEDRIHNSSSMRGLIHRSLRSIETKSIYGSATLCLISIDKSSHRFRSFNLGDSGFMLIRSNHLIYRSIPQYHRGSSPFQLSSFPKNDFIHLNKTRLYNDKPSDGHYYEGQLQFGDLILIASDGLFDNLYEDFILQIIQNHLDDQSSPQSLQNVCQILVQSASHARIKRDDILVLLCSMVLSSQMSTNSIVSSSSSSSSSSTSIHVDQSEEIEEESLNLFIFED